MRQLKKPSPSFPSLPQAFGLMGFVLLFSIIIAIPVVGILGTDSEWYDLGEALIYCGSFFLVIFYANRQRRSAHFPTDRTPSGIYFLIVLMVPAWIVVIEPIIDLIPMTEWARKLFEDFRPKGFLKISMIVAAAPLLEEFLFRGIILNGFLNRYSPWKAILLSSFLFGLMHLNPWQFVVAFGLGNMLGWLYWRTRSILPCIFLHYVNNSVATVLNLGKESTGENGNFINDPLVHAVVFVFALLILIVCTYASARILKANTLNLQARAHLQPV